MSNLLLGSNQQGRAGKPGSVPVRPGARQLAENFACIISNLSRGLGLLTTGATMVLLEEIVLSVLVEGLFGLPT
nr:hypothetical protein [Dictyobacter kobayashii]